MFSPDVTSTASARSNPRRRVRAAASDDSLTAPNRPSTKRRKRSSLAPDTFEPTSNGHVSASDETPVANGHRSTGKLANGHSNHGTQWKESSPEITRSLREIALTEQAVGVNRGKSSKRGERRGIAREQGVVQAETEHYAVLKDGDLPIPLQSVLGKGEQQWAAWMTKNWSIDVIAESWRADVAPGLGYAVALTHTQAIVWPYTHEAGFVDGSTTLSIRLPFPNAPTRYSRDPLPLSALVHDAGAGELALLVVLPTNGKLVYWESLTSAAKADTARQRQQSIHGALTGLYSSEHVQEIIEAEPDGFVLTTSYGRLFHLSVRDLQGRPRVSSSILQAEYPTSSGFLGSLRSVFAGSMKKDIAAVHSAPARSKSSRTCLVAHVDGFLQCWELARHGSRSLEMEVSTQEAITTAVNAIHPARADQAHALRIWDFAFSSRSHGDRNDVKHHRIMLLCSYGSGRASSCYLVDGILNQQSFSVQVVHPITRLPKTIDAKNQDARLRLHLPQPEHCAFIIAENCIILASIREAEESPDTQLQLEAHTLAEPFQDVLMLNTKRNYRIVASAVRTRERGSDKAAVHLLVDHFGFARAAAAPAIPSESDVERRAYLCRSQIEQGVFFGNQGDGLLDFSSSFSTSTWTSDEVEATALLINDSILSNQSKRVATVGVTMDEQLRKREAWLQQLLLYVGKAKLSESARWHMLWSAEKVSAARAVWESYSRFLEKKNLREKLLLPDLLDIMSEEHKHENRPELGETDIVRHYLLNDIPRIGLLIPYAEYALQELHGEGAIRKPTQEARLIQQAIELQLAILKAAFTFRKLHAGSYGFAESQFEEGLYKGTYQALPQFWTSSEEALRRTKQLIEQTYDFTTTANEVSSPIEGEDIDVDALATLVASIPPLIEFCCRTYEERYRWLRAQPGSESEEQAQALRNEYQKTRQELIVKLLNVELESDGFALGEQYDDMDTLAELLARSNAYNLSIRDAPASADEEVEAAVHNLEQNVERMDRYFTTYGEKWAEATFGYNIQDGSPSVVLKQASKYDAYVDRFLASKASLKKLRWMQAVAMEEYELGGDLLEETSHEEESLWACKVNLSMAKLCRMAAHEQKQIAQSGMLESNKRVNTQLAISEMQEQFYEFTRPVLRAAIDSIAEVDLAMESYGRFVQDKPYLEGVLREGFEKLLSRHRLDAEVMLDMLTLIAPSGQEDEGSAGAEFLRMRFVMALRLLRLCGFEEARAALHKANLWRRCILQDNWKKLNRTENMTDAKVVRMMSMTTVFQTLVAGIEEGLVDGSALESLDNVIGAGTTPALLRGSAQYATAADELIEAVAADLLVEDVALAEALKKGRLEPRWPSLVDTAKRWVGKQQQDGGAKDRGSITNGRIAEADAVMA